MVAYLLASGAPAGLLRRLAAGLGILLIAVLLLEGGLRIASLFAKDRGGAWRSGSSHRVLAVGDSHTYGAFMPRDQTYPAFLQKILDREAPGVHSVLNRGVPGMNTAQVLNRLPTWLTRHEPDVVVVWVGINNSWNAAERGAEGSPFLRKLAGWASQLRVYRLVRVWLHDRRLERVVGESSWKVASVEDSLGEAESWRIFEAGREARVVHRRVPEDRNRADEIEAEAEADYAAMVALVRAAGGEVVFITYPFDADWFAVANRAVRRVAERTGAPVVDASRAVLRLPPEQRELTWAAHPTGPMYLEIARDVAVAIDSVGGP